jgi:carbonic anhydrase
MNKFFSSRVFASVLGVVLVVSLSSCDSKVEVTQNNTSGALNYSQQNSWEQTSGQSQSPIAISSSDAKSTDVFGPIHVYFESLNSENLTNNGHSLEVEGSGTFVLSNTVTNFTQVHFHAPSEHVIDGKQFPLEAHFVCKGVDGKISVVAVMFDDLGEGAPNPVLDEILSAAPKEVSEEGVEIEKLDFKSLFPQDLHYFHYLGSLTTPPLTETVDWYVVSSPVAVSSEQIERFHEFYNGNNRSTQDLNGRVVVSD